MSRLDIIKTIAENGFSSGKKIAEKFKCDISTNNPIIKALEKEELIKPIFKNAKGKPGGQEKFFCLTQNGLQYFIQNIKSYEEFTLKEFFRSLFLSYDKRTRESKISIDEMLSSYERKVLQINRKYFPFLIDEIFEWTKKYLKEWHIECKRVLELLACEGVLSVTEIYKKLVVDEASNFIWEQHVISEKRSEMIEKLIRFGLVTTVSSNKETKFTLTVFGLLILLRYTYKEPSFKNGLFLSNEELLIGVVNKAEFVKKIELIRRNYEYLLPKIFKNWSELKKVTHGQEYIISSLMILFFTQEQSARLPFYLTGPLGLFSIQKAMAIEFNYIVRREYSDGINALKEWANENGKKIDSLTARDLIISGIVKKKLDKMNQKNNHLDKDLYFVPEVMKLLTNLEAVRITKDDLLMEDISLEKAVSNIEIKKSISDTIEFRLFVMLRTELGTKFDKFLEDVNLLDWFNCYEDEIIQFGENNLKNIKENILKYRTPIV